MRLLRFLFVGSRPRLAAGLATGLLGGLMSALALSMIFPAIEAASISNKYLVVFASAATLSVVFNMASEQIASLQAQDVLLKLRLNLARQVLSTSLERLEKLGAASLLTALTEDAMAISNALPGLAQMCPQVAIVVGCLAYMLWLAPWGFGVVVVLMVGGLLVFFLPQRFATLAIDAGRANSETLMSHFRALVEGIKQLQVHQGRASQFLDHRLEPTARSSRRNALRAFEMHLVGANVGRAFFLIAIFAIVILSSLLGASRSLAAAFALAVLYLTRPMEVILSWVPAIGRANVALSRLDDLGMELDAPRAHGGGLETREPCRVTLAGCTYEHRSPSGEVFKLGPIDLSLIPGELVFLVGGNGGGKTTLAKLLVGLFPPKAGQILVNGEAPTDRETYRALFSVVFADSFPFDDLRLPHEVGGVLKLLTDYGLGHDHFDDIREKSANTLSHGQRKRALLLSALAEDRPVYVFDEWAAEQDPLFKDVFYRDVLPALRARGKSVLVITHDNSYFHLADRLFRLEYGSLLDSSDRGPPRTSVAVSGLS